MATSSNTGLHRIIQNYQLVWLDETIDEINNDDCRNVIIKLREIVNTVHTFINVDECVDFITDIKQEIILMLLSSKLQEIMIPIVQEIAQVHSVYIFTQNDTCTEQVTNNSFKTKGIFIDINAICTELKDMTKYYDQNSISFSFVKKTDEESNRSLDTLDSSFMYTQILKEILLTIDFKRAHIEEFLTYYRQQFIDNNSELENADKIETEYHRHQPIWWYTYNCFLYSTLNRALRLMEVDTVIKMGFFLKDLHNDIATLHSEQFGGDHYSDSFTVYRGQALSQTDFDKLKETQGGLLSFNNFLSTSLDHDVSLTFAQSNAQRPGMIGVLLVITGNPSRSSYPFANIKDVSHFDDEEEILFSMHSIFRIDKVEQMEGNDRLWQVNLTLTCDNDPDLHAVTEHIRKETFPHQKGWYRLGYLLIKLGQYDKAQQVYDIMFEQTTDEKEKGSIYHMLGVINYGQGNYADAVKYYNKSVEIQQKALPENQFDLPISYDNIGLTYYNMGEYPKALEYYEKALEINQKWLPTNLLHLAHSYNNIGLAYDNMAEYLESLKYHEKAFEIFQNNLPANHPVLACSCDNIANVYNKTGEHLKALFYYEKVLEISRKILPANHPDLTIYYNNIGSLYNSMGDASKALSYYEKVLEISQNTLPANHPLLAICHNNMGSVYYKLGEHSIALTYYEKALEILQKTLPANHPAIATSYNNIGLVYKQLDEYSIALTYYEKAREIRENILSPNHPDLAESYNNLGWLYYDMGDYSQARLYLKRALNIWQNTPSPHQSYIETLKKNIELL